MKSSFFVPNSRNRYGCEIPARSAIVSVDVPWKPVEANSALRRLEDRLAALLGRHPGGRGGAHGPR